MPDALSNRFIGISGNRTPARIRWFVTGFAFGALLVASGCVVDHSVPSSRPAAGSTESRIALSGAAIRIVAGARAQLKNPAHYTGEYYSIPYPGGDVPPDKGACVDVVIRALRPAGYDLQKLIHEDIEQHLTDYPRHGDRPDTNIDHRRVPNQRYFLSRFGTSLSIRTDGTYAKSWKPGDIVTWQLDNGLDHTGVLSDLIDSKGLPFVIHNISETAEEDVLAQWKITGHYRFPKQ